MHNVGINRDILDEDEEKHALIIGKQILFMLKNEDNLMDSEWQDTSPGSKTLLLRITLY